MDGHFHGPAVLVGRWLRRVYAARWVRREVRGQTSGGGVAGAEPGSGGRWKLARCEIWRGGRGCGVLAAAEDSAGSEPRGLLWWRHGEGVGEEVGVLDAEVVFAEEAGLEGAVQTLVDRVGVAYPREVLDCVFEHGRNGRWLGLWLRLGLSTGLISLARAAPGILSASAQACCVSCCCSCPLSSRVLISLAVPLLVVALQVLPRAGREARMSSYRL